MSDSLPLSASPHAGRTTEPDFINNELRRRLNLPSVQTVEELMQKRKIHYPELRRPTVRFPSQEVLQAIAS